jgi:hypothetical protein
MATVLTPAAGHSTLREYATVRVTNWHQLKRAIHRRTDRIERILLVLIMVLPQLIIVLLGGD